LSWSRPRIIRSPHYPARSRRPSSRGMSSSFSPTDRPCRHDASWESCRRRPGAWPTSSPSTPFCSMASAGADAQRPGRHHKRAADAACDRGGAVGRIDFAHVGRLSDRSPARLRRALADRSFEIVSWPGRPVKDGLAAPPNRLAIPLSCDSHRASVSAQANGLGYAPSRQAAPDDNQCRIGDRRSVARQIWSAAKALPVMYPNVIFGPSVIPAPG